MPQPPESIMPARDVDPDHGPAAGGRGDPELPGFQRGRQAGPPMPRRRRRDRHGSDRPPDSGRLPGRWYGYDAARAIVARHRRPRDARGARRPARAAAGRLGQAGRPSRRLGRCQLAGGARQRPGPDPAGSAQRAGAGASLEALDTFAGSTKPITPPGTPPVHGHQARGGRGARRDGPEHDVEPAAGRPRRPTASAG